ncbi:MAG: hypothetical protein AB7I41_24675 [Candidatus Sericytochromatia bacterium]
MNRAMRQRYSLAVYLGLSLMLGACDNTTTNGPKNVVNQTTNTAPQVVNNTTIINQTNPSASPTVGKASASPVASSPSALPNTTPTATPAASCGKLNIQADGSWDFPRPDKTPRILKTGDYQLFQDGSAKITKAGEPDVGAIIKAPACNTGTTTPVVNASPTPVASAQAACKLDIKADGSWNFPRPDKTPRILRTGDYQLFPDGSAKITKAGEPDVGKIVRPSC